MSILGDLGTKIGILLKGYDNRINTLENVPVASSTNRVSFKLSDYQIGSRPDYARAVVPLCELTNASISNFSYTSGRFDFVRTNGCCSQLPLHVEIKMQKAYNSTSPMWFTMHNNLPDNIKPCTYEYGGIKYGGLEVYYNVQSHHLYFIGFTTLDDIYDSGSSYIRYIDVRDGSVINTEINDSLVIL
jgi:hypothetical protein